jgi:hypothetical protein
MTDKTHTIDAFVPLHPKDLDMLPYCVIGLRKNVNGLRNIYVVSEENPEDIDDIIWVPESKFPFSMEDVAAHIKSTNKREGWYLQQLFKMYAFRVIEGCADNLLLFDADCVICRPISFFDENRALLDWTEEQIHAPYFEHASKVLKEAFVRADLAKSGITDHMLVRRHIMEEILQKIEQGGRTAWQILLEAVDPSQWDKSGMSEYEIYYNYALKWYPDEYWPRRLTREIGLNLAALSHDSHHLDILAFHAWALELRRDKLRVL